MGISIKQRLGTVAVFLFVFLVVLGCVGCADSNKAFITEHRMQQGLVIVLPGIEGESAANQSIRTGLNMGGVGRGIPIHLWGNPVPGVGMIINQVDFIGNRIAGRKVAARIIEYQDRYPGRPVHVIGHSGGGGVAVFAAEAMPDGRKIDGLILLSASISSSYDLTRALRNCKNGIVNFYNKDDGALLAVGTTVMGNVDGIRGPSAGLIGFDPVRISDTHDKKRECQKLYQVELTKSMSPDSLAHFATTQSGFVLQYVSPWVLAEAWPADTSVLTVPTRTGLFGN